MDDLLKLAGGVVGGTGVLGMLAWGMLYVTRSAIAKAVEQAGICEVERLKATLSKELEKERQAFARDIEREKLDAARALEEYKATLTLDAEVRRQAACRKVQALLKVSELLTTIIGRVQYDRDIKASIAALDEYLFTVRDAEALLHADVLKALWGYGAFLQENIDAINKPGAHLIEVSQRAESERRNLIAVIRQELHGSNMAQ